MRSIFAACSLVSLALLMGCGALGEPTKPQAYNVSGQVVTKANKPVNDAFLVFHRQGVDEKHLERSQARTKADGTFVLSTYLQDDGAPAGDYKITVVWTKAPSGPAPKFVDPERQGQGVDQLGGRYSDPKMTPLKATIVAGDNPPLKLIVE